MRRAILETAVLVLLSILLGLGTAGLRTPPVPWRLPDEFFVPESGARPILTAHGLVYLEQGGVAFVDVRPEADFIQGHIPGALSIPTERYMDLAAEASGWLEGVPLVLYGATGNVNEADNLAARLLEYGYGPISILAEGYEAWAEAGFPVESGPAGTLQPDAWADEESWDDSEGWDEDSWDDSENRDEEWPEDGGDSESESGEVDQSEDGEPADGGGPAPGGERP